MNMLKEIIAHKRTEIEERKKHFPLSLPDHGSAKRKPGRFRSALSGASISIISEIKKQSPSRGVIRTDFDPVEIASAYQSGGADAISVLTDFRFFGGSAEVFQSVRESVRIPLLRKDFILDEYQLIESFYLKADAVLLIARALDITALTAFIRLAKEYGMDSLVEVHSESELEKAIDAGAEIIGVNNRDLDSFRVDLSTSIRLIKSIPNNILSVSESGIRHRDDVIRLQDAGFHALLVGESLMRETDIGGALRQLRGIKDGSEPTPYLD